MSSSGKTTTVKLSKLKPSALSLRFRGNEVSTLEESITKHGLLHPLVVRSAGEEYEVVCGHRRLEAIQKIGMAEVSCTVIDATDKEAFEISLVENLQRQSIDPVEEALAFHQYLHVLKWGNRRSLASRIGKSPEYVTHRLRLLQLPQDVLSQVGTGLSTSHAEELAWLGDDEASRRLAHFAEEEKVSVQHLHELIRVEKKRRKRSKESRETALSDLDGPDLGHARPESPILHADEVLKTGIAALRYVMYYLGDSADSVGTDRNFDSLRSFLTEERYRVHQIIDDFISAEVRVNRAARSREKMPNLSNHRATNVAKEDLR